MTEDERENERRWRNMTEDERWDVRFRAAWNSTHETAREAERLAALSETFGMGKAELAWLAAHQPSQLDALEAAALEVTAWAERNAYFVGSPGQIEGRPMTPHEAVKWDLKKGREELEVAILREIDWFVGKGIQRDHAEDMVRTGGGEDKGAVARLSAEFHALEGELRELAVEPGAANAQVSEEVAEPDDLSSTRLLLGVQDVVETDAPTPEAVPDFEQATEAGELARAHETREASGNGWRYGLAPAQMRPEVLSPVVDQKAEQRRHALEEREERERAAAELYQKNRAGLAEFRQQAAVEPTPSPVETVVDGPALPSYYHLEDARPLVPSMVPELDLTSAAEAVAETLMWDEPEAQEAVTEAPEWEADQQHAMARLGGVQEVADREGWEAEPETPAAADVLLNALDQLGASVSEMAPEERAAFLADDDISIVGLRGRLVDPEHEPVLGPGARITADELREEARQAEAAADARLSEDIASADKARMAEIEGREEVARRWAEYDGPPMTPDPAKSAELASRTFENDQMKAEQAKRARKQREVDEPSREPEPPGQEPQL